MEERQDLISRQAAIDAVSRGCEEWRGIFAECEKNLNELPSAQLEQQSFSCDQENDLISRQAAIDALGEEPEVWSGKDEYEQGLNNQWHYDVIALKALPSAQPEQRWISVNERLPDEGERVLCTHTGRLNPNRQVIEHIYQNGKFILGWDMDMNPSSPTFGQRYMGDVVAWMPLPEPYREEGGK